MKNNDWIRTIINNRWMKNIEFLLGYWIAFNALPFLLTRNQHESSYFSLAMFILVLVSPFLVFIPYKLAKLNHNFEAIIFLLAGISVPLICIVYIFQNIRVGLF